MKSPIGIQHLKHHAVTKPYRPLNMGESYAKKKEKKSETD